MSNRRHRTAAMRLAALHPADRRWVLKRLPATQRDILGPLVADLLRAGKRDPLVFIEALEQQSREEASDTTRTFAQLPCNRLHAELDKLPAEWAAAALLGEPPTVLAAYAKECAPLRRDSLLDTHSRLNAEPPAKRLQQVLKDAVHERCTQEADSEFMLPTLWSAAS